MPPLEEELLLSSQTGAPPSSTLSSFSTSKSLGNAAFASGDFSTALSHYSAASLADPTSPIPHTNSSLALLRLSRPFDAAEAASTALALLAAHPDRPDTLSLTTKTLLRRAAARRETNQDALAAEDLREILALNPEHPEATRQLRQLGHSLQPTSAGLSASTAAGASSTPAVPSIRVIPSTDPPAAPAEPTSTLNGHPPVPGSSPPPRAASAEVGASAGRVRSGTSPTAAAAAAVAGLVARAARTPPRNSSEFEQAWRSLRSLSAVDRARYLALTVGAERLRRGLLGETLTSEMLQEVVVALGEGVEGWDEEGRQMIAKQAVEVLEALKGVPRFDIATMFWGDREKVAVGTALRNVMEKAVLEEANSERLGVDFGVA